MSERPTTVLDPVCGMTVNVSRAESEGLTTEYEGRTYAFCRSGCQLAFGVDPTTHTTEPMETPTTRSTATGLPVIDEGMRRWYENCSCCLSDAYPEIKADLDAERAASPAGPGICEVAEAH